MNEKIIPDIVIGRLPYYLRTLQRMCQQGQKVTSSQELGERLGISAAQIRKDLSQFGEFGKQGTGYQVDYLMNELQQIMHVNVEWNIAIVGAGDIGSAIAHYKGFANRGFRVAMVFDKDPHKIGTQVGSFMIQDSGLLDEILPAAGIRVALITVPADQAQSVSDQLVKAGVRAILCYAPISLNVPQNVYVQYIDPVIHLQRLTYYLD